MNNPITILHHDPQDQIRAIVPFQTEPKNQTLAALVPFAPPHLQEHLATSIRYVRRSRAKNTQAAIVRDMKTFSKWCATVNRPWLPADSETIAAFAIAMMESRKPATIRRYVASISAVHKWMLEDGTPNPADHKHVKEALTIVGRTLGSRQKQAAPINLNLRTRMIKAALTSGKPWGRRDAAMIAIAYDAMARRAELVGERDISKPGGVDERKRGIWVEDITFHEDGTGTVLIAFAKGDQEGEGSTRYLHADTVSLIKDWMEEARIKSGPIFLSVDRWGNIREDAMSLQAVNKAFKRLAEEVGENPDGIGGHSCRVGMAQDMVEKGLGTAEIMQAGGWKTSAMVARYSEKQRARKGAAAKMALLQNR